MDNQPQPTGFEALKQHVILNKIDVALWCTRGLTLVFCFFYLIPIYWSPYYKALAAYAATSALRLHQRRPPIRMDTHFFAPFLAEDSCHYLIYSLIFFYVAPFTLVLIPIFCFSLIHFSSYSIRLLDVLGQNSLWMARLFISLVEFNARSILNLIAFTEIILMPFCIILVVTGRAPILTPIMYHQFLLMRYKSQRNPSTRNMFYELKTCAMSFADPKRGLPAIVRKIIMAGVNLVCLLGPNIPQSPQQ